MDIGVDIVEIDRIKKTCQKSGGRFLKRVFTEQELEYCLRKVNPFPHLAARFAAKEAVCKALNLKKKGIFSWREIEVISQSSGKPTVQVSGLMDRVNRKNKVKQILVSLSHSKKYAVAQVVVC